MTTSNCETSVPTLIPFHDMYFSTKINLKKKTLFMSKTRRNIVPAGIGVYQYLSLYTVNVIQDT